MPEIRIEDKPELRGFTRRAFEMSFTSVMWGFWIYMFLPLLSLLLWAAGVHYIYHYLFEADALDQLLKMLVRMGWAVLVVFLLLRGWGFYNYYAFGRLERRKGHAGLSGAEIGRHFGLTEREVQILQAEKEIAWAPSYDALRQRSGVLRPQLVRTGSGAARPEKNRAGGPEQPGILQIELPEA